MTTGQTKTRIVSCGEALIDFLPLKTPDGPGYLPRPGGSPFNVAIGAARLGANAGFLGRISTDFFGDSLVAALTQSGVSHDYVVRSDDPSTLAFVSLPDGGEPQYAFFNNTAADRNLSTENLPADLSSVAAIHVGSFSLAIDPVGATLERLIRAERNNRLITLDPNVRPSLVGERTAYVARLERLIGLAHLVKVSVADLEWLYPGVDPAEVEQRWLALGPSVIVVTHGGDGVSARTAAGRMALPGKPVDVVDTVGAGDSFMSGLLVALLEHGHLEGEALARLDEAKLAPCLAFAQACAAVTCSRAGANLPRRDAIPADVVGQGRAEVR